VLHIYEEKAGDSLRGLANLKDHCGQLEGITLCTLRSSELNLGPLPRERPVPVWPPERKVLRPAEMEGFLGMGWNALEENGVWSFGYVSELYIGLPSCSAASQIRFRILPFIGTEGQRVTATANGGPPASGSYSEGIIQELTVGIGACDAADPVVRVTFIVDQPMSPLEMGQGHDDRQLGVLLVDAELL
jgi:hypothetical protein